MDSERDNPYVGTRPFEEADSQYFYGREQESRQLTSLIVAHRVVLFYAQSGAGKTSLLQASVIPNLNRRYRMSVLPVARVTGELPAGWADGEGSNIYVFNLLSSLAGEGADLSGLLGKSLQDGLAPYLEACADGGRPRPCLLILDQFEELFTTYLMRHTERGDLFHQLQECLAAFPRLSLLLTMREDYIAQLDPYTVQMPDRLRTRYRMQRLDAEGALQAVEGPARRAGRPFEPGAARPLVDNLRRIQVGTLRQTGTGEQPLGLEVEPLHLQIVCRRLWEDLPPGGGTIRAEDVRDFGNVDQALIGAYEEGLSLALQAVTPEACSQRQLRTWFQQELITPIGTRGLVFRGQQETAGVPNAAVDVLDDVYLLRRVRRGDDVWYELAHDRLVDPIRQANDAWQQARLAAAPWLGMVEAWEKQDHPQDLLLRGEALRAALVWWMVENPWELSDQEVAFLDASLHLLYSELGVNLDELGWGAIFGQGTDPRIQSALKELLEHRQAQAGDRYVLYAGKEGYRQGELATDFLRRHGIESQGFPHYLLIVGSPAEIPFEFQYALAERHAVGRIHFSSPDEYARYARSLVTAERGPVALAREAVFFNAQSSGDRAMQITVEQLTEPLARRLQGEVPQWEIRTLLRDEATKARLRTHLGGAGTPALLFYAGQGLEFAKGDPLQPSHQGALLCAEWPGSGSRVTPDFAFSGKDLEEDARLLGLIAFLVGPHTAGTPRQDDFAHRNVGGKEPLQFADQPFLASLPQRLLGHPNGGALAVIGHVDRAWLSIFQNLDGAPDIEHFVGTLTRLMSGHTVGSALEPFRHRRALLATRLGQEAAEALFAPRGQYGQLDITSPLVDLRTRTLDSRNYIIIGDPAARLPQARQPAPVGGVAGAIIERAPLQQRPVIDPVVAVEDESVGPSLATRLYELDAAAQRLLDQLQVDSWIWQVPRSQDLPEDVASEIAQVLDSFRILGPDAGPAPQTLYRLAMLAAFRGDEELAVDCLRQATRADPDYGQAFEAITWLQQRRSRADMETRDYAAAAAKLQEARYAAQKWRLPERALLNEGYIAKDQAYLAQVAGDPAAAQEYRQEAENCFQRAIEVNPYDASALNGLGNLEYQAHNYRAAVDLMERAIALAPNYTFAYHDLGGAAMALMRQDPVGGYHWCRKALTAFETALSLAERDASFGPNEMRRIRGYIAYLKKECGPGSPLTGPQSPDLRSPTDDQSRQPRSSYQSP